MALCQQEPWVLNDTVRENILFGQPYNKDFLSCVIDACDLRHDINNFPQDDLTEVGERVGFQIFSHSKYYSFSIQGLINLNN